MSAVTLRGYQREAIEQARAQLRNGVKRLIISAATGAGKTEISMAIIEAAVAKGSRVSFIADRRALVQQTSRRFDDAGIRHGILMGADTVGTHEPVRVESAQTIMSRGLRQGTDLFVIDEAHENRAEIIRLIATSGATLIGLTATPFPQALAEPIDVFNPTMPRYESMVCPITTDQLIADGFLCPFDVVAPVAAVDTEGVETQGGEFKRGQIARRVLRIVGEIVPTWQAQIDERFGGRTQPTIAFGASVDDASAIAQSFRDAGHDARMVSSRESDEDNQKVIAAFRDGAFDVLVNCAILSRGVDFPRATVLVDAYPMRRMLTPIQRYGRVMRLSPGKSRALVIDHAGNWISMRDSILAFYHGGPSWPPDEEHSGTARKKKPDADVVCRVCRTVLAPEDAVCPHCGTPRPVRTFGGSGSTLERVDGRLQLVDSVTGQASAYGGDLWAEVCTEALRLCHGDEHRASKRALASYRAIRGQWPAKRDFAPLDRAPDPAVSDLMRRNFQAWLIARKAVERRA